MPVIAQMDLATVKIGTGGYAAPSNNAYWHRRVGERQDEFCPAMRGDRVAPACQLIPRQAGRSLAARWDDLGELSADPNLKIRWLGAVRHANQHPSSIRKRLCRKVQRRGRPRGHPGTGAYNRYVWRRDHKGFSLVRRPVFDYPGTLTCPEMQLLR